MKKIIYAVMAFAALLATSCKKDMETTDVEKPLFPGATVDTIRGVLTGVTNITKNTFIDGIVYVDSNATINIPAGITMVGKATAFGTAPDPVNLANNKGTLVVQRGAKINANGTAVSPIIWTSANPVGSRNPGDWGGLVILGNAPIATSTGAFTNIFEAFVGFDAVNPVANGRNNYGGGINANAADNSGSITYNIFAYGGGLVTAINAEVNGVTLCGVGNGTNFNHIKVSNSADDAFQFFGGTVNATYLFSYGNKDDDFVFEEGYNGNLQFIIAYRTDLADNSGSVMLQADNNKTTLPAIGQRRTKPFIANATLIGPASSVAAINPGGQSPGRFDAAIITNRGGRLILVNSLIIAEAMTYAFVTTPSTDTSFFPPAGGIAESPIYNNIFQTRSTVPVVFSFGEGVPVLPGSGISNTALTAQLGAQANTAVASFNSFSLGGFLQNQPASPSFTGGINLTALGIPGFTGTAERGAVISTNIWTLAPWVSM